MSTTNLNELFTALSKAQKEMKNAEKDGVNPHFKSQYATLTSVWDAAREALTNNNLSVVQMPSYTQDGKIVVTTVLGHASGQCLRFDCPVVYQGNTMQALGSALTYARRYSLSAVVGVASQEDDDDATKSQEQHTVPAPKTVQVAVSNTTDATVPIGRYKGKLLSEVPLDDLQSTAYWMKQKAEAEGKPLKGTWQTFVSQVEKMTENFDATASSKVLPTKTNGHIAGTQANLSDPNVSFDDIQF